MTRMHFEAIAATLAKSRPLVDTTPSGSLIVRWKITCCNMADTLATFNKGFSRSRFLSACGVEIE